VHHKRKKNAGRDFQAANKFCHAQKDVNEREVKQNDRRHQKQESVHRNPAANKIKGQWMREKKEKTKGNGERETATFPCTDDVRAKWDNICSVSIRTEIGHRESNNEEEEIDANPPLEMYCFRKRG
jgi:sRNA-binding protein